MPKFKIAICGGGIAGLTLAIAMNRYAPPDAPVQVDIYEADSEVRTAGAGITVWPRTWAVMRHLGLYDDLLSVAVRSGMVSEGHGAEFRPAFVARRANQSSEGYTFARVLAPSGTSTMHRRDMIDVFLRHLPASYKLHTSKRLVKYTSANDCLSPMTLLFADGTTAETDHLVGADGVHSATRMCMYDHAHRNECVSRDVGETPLEKCTRCAAACPKWTGVHAYRSLLPTAKLYSLNPAHATASLGAILCYSGKGKHVITYQISGGKFLNFVMLHRVPGGEGSPHNGKWVTEVSRDEVVSHLNGWESDVQQMVECVENPTRWAIHVVDSLPFAVSGRVALLGDAMHAMPPNFGAGGGQSIEDACILGRLLADARVSLRHAPDVLAIYERIRLPFAKDVARRGRDVGFMYDRKLGALGEYDMGVRPHSVDGEEHDGEAGAQETTEQLDRLGEAIYKMWEWQWTEDVHEQWVQAEEELDVLIGGQVS